MTDVSPRRVIFHPAVVAACSLAFACLYAAYAAQRFGDAKLSNQYLYVVPIVIPFVAFLFDRAERFGKDSRLGTVVDVLVIVTAMWRVIGDVPFVSGHALFLSYALLSSRSRIARVSAGAVMLEVIYLKYFVWHDHVTATVGMIIGAAAALCLRLSRRDEARPFGDERDSPRLSESCGRTESRLL